MTIRRLKILSFLLLLLLILADNSFSGAWVQQKGHYYTKLTYIYSTSDAIFGINFPAKFDNYSVYFYGEYGVLDRFTVTASMPTFKRSVSEANHLLGATNGYMAGDLELQAKYQVLDRPIVTSVLGGVKLPVGYGVYDLPPLGNDQTDYDVKLLLGASLYPIPVYMTGDAGFRKRGGDFVNEFNYTFEAGYTLLKRYLLRFMINGIQSLEDAAGESTLLGFPLDQDQMRLGGGLILIVNQHTELDFTYLKTTSGKNIPKFTEIFVGIAFKK